MDALCAAAVLGGVSSTGFLIGLQGADSHKACPVSAPPLMSMARRDPSLPAVLLGDVGRAVPGVAMSSEHLQRSTGCVSTLSHRPPA